MPDATFDILIRSVAEPAAVERMRANVRALRTDLSGVNDLLAQNKGNFALSAWGDRLDISKISTAASETSKLAAAGRGAEAGLGAMLRNLVGIGSIATVVTAALAAVTTVVLSASRTLKSLVQEIDTVTNRIGISGETYQAYKIVLQEAGQEASALVPALDRLNQVIGDAATGSEPAQLSLQRLGLTYQALKGLRPEEQFELVARGLSRISDASARAAAMQDVLGRSASQLRPLLSVLAQGGFAEVEARLKSTGDILSNPMAKALDDIADRSEAAARRAAIAWAEPLRIFYNILASVGELMTRFIQLTKLPEISPPQPNKNGPPDKKGETKGWLSAFSGPVGYPGGFIVPTPVTQADLAPPKPPVVDEALKVAEETAKADRERAAAAEIEAKEAKKRAEQDLALEIQLAAARKAELQTRIEQGNALFLQAEEQKRQQAIRDKALAQAAAEREMNAALTEQANIRSEIEGDWSSTTLEKRPRLIASLVEENRLIAQRLALLAEERETADPVRRGQIDQQSTDLGTRARGNLQLLRQPDPYSYADQFSSTTTQLNDQVGSAPQQLSQAWGQAAGSIRSSMQGAFADIFNGSMSLAQAASAAPAMMGQAFLQAGAQMAADWVWKHVFMAGVSKAWHAADVAIHGGAEAAKTGASTAGAATRVATRSAEAGHSVAMTGVETTVHAGGETAKTGASFFGAITRKGIQLGETVFHGVQVAIRTGAHLLGETLKTGATIAGAALRLPIIIGESIAHVFQAGAGALAAMSSIPYIGPILAIAAMGTIVAAGVGLVGKIGKHADGTIVRGRGTQTSDSILAYLSAGEAVIPANRVAQYGESFIGDLIAGRALSSRTIAVPAQGPSPGGRPENPAQSLNLAVVLDPHFGAQLVSSKPGRKVVTRVTGEAMREFGWES